MQATRMIKRALDAAEQVGAVAGGALPALSLTQYLAHDLPGYRRAITSAPEFGSLEELGRVLRPGDIGIASNYNAEDKMLQLLNSGSAHMSGSGMSHGQVVGPKVNRFVDSAGTVFQRGQLSKRDMKLVEPRSIPTIFHGGTHSAADQLDAFNTWVTGIPNAVGEGHRQGLEAAGKARGLLGKAKGYAGGLLSSPGIFGDFRKKQQTLGEAASKLRGSNKFVQMASTIYDDAASYPDRSYLYLRSKNGPIPSGSPQGRALRMLLSRESAAAYDTPGAFAAGFRSILAPRMPGAGPAVRTLNQELGRTGGKVNEALKGIRCDASGHHCGSLPATILQRLNLGDRRRSARLQLPAVSALNENLAPVGIVNRAGMLKNLRRSAIARTGLGLAATAAGSTLGAKTLGTVLGTPATLRQKVQELLQRKLSG